MFRRLAALRSLAALLRIWLDEHNDLKKRMTALEAKLSRVEANSD